IHRVFNILLRAGELPALPPGLRPRDLEVEYLSPVARAQKQYEAQALVQAVEYLNPFVQGGDPHRVMDNFETDRIARHAAEMFGTPGDYLRPEKEVLQIRRNALERATRDTEDQGEA
ncbi:MAG: portal protein, partial [Desulfovibrionaceae bacterium]